MVIGYSYIVWLNDSGARAFLGLVTAQPQCRWLVVGEHIAHEESGVGFWLRVDHAERWTPTQMTFDPVEQWSSTHKIGFHVSPATCLIRWDWVITIQAIEEGDVEPEPDEWVPTQPPGEA
jgi:hypothetical protein